MQITEKIKELSQEIKKTDRFKKYQESKKIFEQDTQARNLLNSFQEAKNELAILQQGRFEGAEEQREKTEQLSLQVLENKTIQDYMQARNQFNELMEELAVAISEELDFPIKLPEKKSCCG